MKMICRIAASVCFAIVGWANIGNGQTSVAAQPASKASTVASVLTKPVSISLHDVTLDSALQRLAAEAKVRINYRMDILAAERRQVSITAEREPLGVVLDRVLRGTHLHAIASARDILTIRRIASAISAVQGKITGRVTASKTGVAISAARILVDGKPVATTGDNGTFEIELESGEYTLQVQALGYVRQVRTIRVTDNVSVAQDFLMESSASVLNEVVVTGTVVATERKAISTPITVITGADLERRGITRIEQLFRGEVPGVFAYDQGSEVYDSDRLGAMETAKVYTRGSSTLPPGDLAVLSGSNPLKTYIDGVELLDPSYLGTIDPASIERIEIITGPQAATVYGSGAMGGVMQIFTKKGKQQQSPELALKLEYGVMENNLASNLAPLHNHRLNLNGGTGPAFSYSGNLSYNYSGQWSPFLFTRRVGTSIGATHLTGPLTVSGSVSMTNGQNGTSGGSLLNNKRQSEGAWTGRVGVIPSQIRGGSKSQTLALNVDYRVMSFWQHHLTIGRSQTNFALEPDAPRFGSPLDSLFRTRSSAGERASLSYNMTFSPQARDRWSSNVTLGFTGSSSEQHATNGCLATSSATSLLPCGSSVSGQMSVTQSEDQSYGGFGRWQLGLFDRLYLNLGVRGEHNPNYGDDHRIDWTPTNGITYTFEAGDWSVKLLGSYGRATRAPQADQRLQAYTIDNSIVPSQWMSRVANEALRPEFSRGPQGGFELYYGNMGSLTVNHYSQTVTDLIQAVQVDSILLRLSGVFDYWQSIVQYQNTATIRQRGWEVTGNVSLWRFNVAGVYSWNENRVITTDPNSQTILQPGQVFIGIPTSTANIKLGYAHGRTNVNLSINVVGRVLREGRSGPIAEILLYEGFYNRTAAYASLIRQNLEMIDMAHTVSGYAKSDLSALHRLSDWASLTLQVTNLGNSYGTEASLQYPTLGRQTRFGATLRYRQ